MTVQEAYKVFKKAEQKIEVMSCYEFDNCFVFHAVPSEFATPVQAAKVFDSLFSMDKKTEKISIFRPTDLRPEERKRRKRIKIYDR